VPLPYRVCAIDLDETLLDDEQKVPARSARTVKQVAELGVAVVLASGRMHEGIQRYGDQIGIAGPVISYNGAMVRDAATNETWLHEEVSGEQAALVMDYCRENDLQLNLYRDGKVLTAEMTPWLELYIHRTKAPYEIVPDFYTRLKGEPSTKLVIINSPEYTHGLKPHFQQVFGSSLYITKTSDEYLEFMPPNANKGSALALVAERLGVPREQTIAFGDSYNDIPMLQWAGLGVAIGNARPAVKESAARIAPTNEECGVATTLEELFGL
jgi:Cof subfamily protein (haloacid dehalogenase superfamily)